MPRIDDYKAALKLAREEVSERNPDLLAKLSGASIRREVNGRPEINMVFLNKDITISWPDLEVSYGDSHEAPPIQQQVLLLHYLNGAWISNGTEITQKWIAFQDLPDGKFYLDAFLKRAKVPLVQFFGPQPELMVKLAVSAYGAEPSDFGDHSAILKAFPLVPLALILWRGDDEFPPEGNILFDKNITGILSAEDIAWLAGMVIYPLIGMAKAKA
jgi:hypothetical protein